MKTMIKIGNQALTVVALCALATVSCDRNHDNLDINPIQVPETYAFENVDYSGQTERQDQLDRMMSYIEQANEPGQEIDLEVLRNMFENKGGNGGGQFNFSSSKQLKDKFYEPDLEEMDAYFQTIAEISKSSATAQNGVAGRIKNPEGDGYRLFDANGFEYAELIEKRIMGGVFYYQATSVYLSGEKMNVDNENVEPGKGTEMQHHWDEAYGYLGASDDFPVDRENVRYWSKYAVSRDALIGSAQGISEPFRLGRAAIVAGNYEMRDAAIGQIRSEWEKLCAANAIHYLNAAISHLSNDYARNHELSEAVAFIENLFYNQARSFSRGEIDEILMLIGDNFYEVRQADLELARDRISSIAGLDAVKNQL
ncbi:MAG: DUF4856 domain-containing protein [Salibacteraceae bacterium]